MKEKDYTFIVYVENIHEERAKQFKKALVSLCDLSLAKTEVRLKEE